MKGLGRFFVVFLVLLVVGMAVACGGKGDDNILDEEPDPVYYTISFDTGGGSVYESVSLAEGARIGELPTPIKEGFVFSYWEERDANGELSDFEPPEFMPSRNVVLYAKWSQAYYLVVFDIGEDAECVSGNVQQMIAHLESATPPTCTREGYDFDSWNGDYTQITEETVITAVWEVATLTCIFSPGADDAVIESGEATHTISYGDSIALLPVFSRPGYRFVGWDYDGQIVDLDNVTNSFTATARWTLLLTATFQGNGGELVEGEEVQVLISGDDIVEPIYSRKGYVQIGWTVEPGGSFGAKIYFDFVATANWQILNYEVTFLPGLEGASKESGNETQSIAFGNAVANTPKYVKEGYVLVGWELDPIDADLSNVGCDIVATGVWEEGYVVTFDPCGGSLVSGELSQIVKYGENAELPVFEKEGFYYSFDISHENITSTTIIKAVWYTQGLEFEEVLSGYKIKGSSILTERRIEEIIIPATYNYLQVKEIEEEAFKDNIYITTVSIPGSVNIINKKAFMGCSNLEFINIPSNISISEYVFANCSSLSSIDISGMAGTNIEKGIFSGCTSLQSISFPTVTQRIKSYAFQGCTSLTTVVQYMPDLASFETIDDYAFDGCVSLVSFVIPTYIWIDGLGEGVFQECTSLTSMVVPNRITKIKDNLFANCTSLGSVTIGNQVTTIGNDAFLECGSLLAITIPNTLESIGQNAFSGCNNLGNVNLSSVKTIGSYAFENCENIVSISSLSNELIIINEGVFAGCKKLATVTLPTSITKLSTKAFLECTSLSSIVIPSNVLEIGKGAFGGCSALEEISLYFIGEKISSTSSNALFGYIFGETEFEGTEVAYQLYYDSGGTYSKNYYVPTSLKRVTVYGITPIPSGAFSGFKKLTNIDISEDITNIGSYAFHSCNSLESFSIPVGVTEINSNTFLGCSSLEEITLPTGITNLREYAFNGCTSLTSISLPVGITSIENYIFSSCSNLEEVEILGEVTEIGMAAFLNCINLDLLSIPSTYTSIGKSAFSGCHSLPVFNIPSIVTIIGESAFKGCSQLITITIPNGVTAINQSTFDSCVSLKHINLPANLIHIGFMAFANCESLLSLSIPNTVESIGSSAFYGCYSLIELTLPPLITDVFSQLLSGLTLNLLILPDGVTSIGVQYESSINKVVMPTTVTNLSPMALGYNLETVYFKGDSSDWALFVIGKEETLHAEIEILYYSETSQTGCWHFDGNGAPVIWS